MRPTLNLSYNYVYAIMYVTQMWEKNQRNLKSKKFCMTALAVAASS